MSWLFKDPVVTMKEIMSRLFKDPINNGLAQFDHAQSNSKKGVKAKEIKLPRMNFVLKKTSNKIFTHLLAPFILQNFKKIYSANLELWGCAALRSKMAHLP